MRLDQRLKIKNDQRFLDKAKEKGLYLEDIKQYSNLYIYILSKLNDASTYYSIIYGRYLLIISRKDDIAITILNIPKNLYNEIDDSKRIKRGETKHVKRKYNRDENYDQEEQWEYNNNRR